MKNQTKQLIKKHVKGYKKYIKDNPPKDSQTKFNGPFTEQTKQQECECHCHSDNYKNAPEYAKLKPIGCEHCQPAKPTESWEDLFDDKWSLYTKDMLIPLSDDVKHFIAKILKEHDEKLVEEMEKLKSAPSGAAREAGYWYNQAIARAIEIVKSEI